MANRNTGGCEFVLYREMYIAAARRFGVVETDLFADGMRAGRIKGDDELGISYFSITRGYGYESRHLEFAVFELDGEHDGDPLYRFDLDYPTFNVELVIGQEGVIGFGAPDDELAGMKIQGWLESTRQDMKKPMPLIVAIVGMYVLGMDGFFRRARKFS